MGRAALDLAFVDAVGHVLMFLDAAEYQDEGAPLRAFRQAPPVADDPVERERKPRTLEMHELADMRLEVLDLQQMPHVRLLHVPSGSLAPCAGAIMPQPRRNF